MSNVFRGDEVFFTPTLRIGREGWGTRGRSIRDNPVVGFARRAIIGGGVASQMEDTIVSRKPDGTYKA
ncbi:MAG: hypothetical protein WBG23_06460, partial [Acidobacteriaceae bacterium]